jgi:hypothetical protein
LSGLIKDLLRGLDEAILRHCGGYSISSHRVGKYTLIKVDVFRANGELRAHIDGRVLVLLRRDRHGEKILAYTVKIRGNRQLEQELRKQLKTLKRQSKREAVTKGSQSSEEKHLR